MDTWHSDQPNIYPESYDYVHLIPGGANTKDVITATSFIFASKSSGKYFIDGDFWAGNGIIVGAGCEIYMKEGAGILAEEGFGTQGRSGYEVTISGIDGKNWKGIAAVQTGLQNSNISIRSTTIKNAGYGIIEMGGFNIFIE